MKKHLYLLFTFILCSAVFLLASCDNFMNGSEAQEQFEKIIDKANAKSYTIIVSQDNTMGSFLSSGDKSCQLGYAIEVQYTVKKDLYIYKGLKAVSKSDESKSLADCVEFTEIDKDDQRGVYKTSIKLVKDSDDILIIPDCVLVPNVVAAECKPDSNMISEQDSTVNIAFNKPVKVVDFLDLSINDTSGQSLTEYFGEPYFSADSKNLLIPVNNQKHLLALTEPETTTKEIIVKLNLASIQDLEGNKGNGIVTHKYRVNNKRDNVIPVLAAAKVYSSNDTEAPNYKELTGKAFSDWASTGDGYGDYGKNHIADSVYIEIEATDTGSGIAGFLLKERLIKNVDGSNVDSVTGSYHIEAKATDVENHYAATYKLNSLNDGIVELEIFAEDNAQNLSKKSVKYYVVKDTQIDSGYITFKEEIGQFPDTSAGWKAAIPVVEGDTQNVSITLSDNAKDHWYSGANCVSDYDIQAFWGYAEDEITNPVKITGNKFTFTRDVNKFVYIKLICKDLMGNEKEIIKRMSPRAEVSLSEWGNMDLANTEMLYILNNDVQAASSAQSITQYCQLIYRFYENENDLQNYTDVFAIPSHNSFFEETEEIINACNLIGKGTEAQEKYTGRIDIFLSSKIGDFPSPRSLNYCTVPVTGWSSEWPYVSLEDKSLSSAIVTETTTVKAFGPENSPYLKEAFKLKAEPKSNGCYKITISDYMTEAAKEKNLTFTFYALPYGAKEYAPEEQVSEEDRNAKYWESGRAVISKNPELFLSSQMKYLFFITATDSEAKKEYAPYEIPDYTGYGRFYLIQNFSYPFYLNNETTTKNELVLTEDLTPPYIQLLGYDVKKYMFNSAGGFAITAPVEMTNNSFSIPGESTLYKNEKGNFEFTYYILPNTTGSLNLIPSYTVSELEKKYSAFAKKFEYEDHSNGDNIGMSLNIPYGNLEEGFYTLAVVAKDKFENTAVYTYPFLNNTLGALPYTKELQSDWIQTDETGNGYSERYYKFNIDANDSKHPEIKTVTVNGNQVSTINVNLERCTSFYGNNWSWEIPIDLCNDEQNNTPSFEHKIPLSTNGDIIDGKWYRLNAWYGFNDSLSVNGKGFYAKEYIYLGTDLETAEWNNNTSWFTCNLKNCFDGLNGVQIFADNDVLVHTMYSSEKLTNSRLDKDAAAIWETKGIETGLMVYERSRPEVESYEDPDNPGIFLTRLINTKDTLNVNYDLSNLSEIPSGCWYTTILHFVDGTVLMTDIKQKQ